MSTVLKAIFIISDLLFLNLSIRFSYFFFGGEIIGDERINVVYLFIFSNLAWLFLVVVSNPYGITRGLGVSRILKNQVSFIFIHLLVVASLIFFFKKNYSPAQIAMIYVLFVPTFFVSKFFIAFVFNLFSKSSIVPRNIIIIGEGELAKEIRRYFQIHRELNYRFLGMFARDKSGLQIAEIQKFCEERGVQEIYCCMSEIDNAEIKKLIDFGLSALIRVKLIADYRSFQQKSLELEHYDQIPVLNITTIPLDETRNQLIKGIFDFIFVMVLFLTILWWLMPLVALAIKLDSPGPVFFRQKRSGKNNKTFICLKFRTMVQNIESETRQATREDTRITKLGKFLRKTSLDEFPQFFNVLEGKMSIVGPRPHMISHTEEYSKLIETFMGRQYVKPGITGLAQCLGYRGETKTIRDMKNRVKLDRFYIENWSLILDIKIIFLTAYSLLRGNEKAF